MSEFQLVQRTPLLPNPRNLITEVYKLDCHGCGRTVEILFRAAVQASPCPICGASFDIRWRPAEAGAQ